MSKVALFKKPKVDPAFPTFPWFPTDRELRFGEITDQIDNSTRERVAVLVSVLGLTHLTELCVDCALKESRTGVFLTWGTAIRFLLSVSAL